MKNFPSFLFLALLVGAGTLSAGCVVRGGAMFRTSPAYDAQLVEVSPGIWVVEDYDDPVFYNDGYYWRYYGGTWYRSHSHTSGWVHIGNHQVPHAVIRIDSPGRYSHYRASGHARVRPVNRRNERVPSHSPYRGQTHDNRRPAPAVRDHRQPAPATRDHRQSAPATRDHRQDHRHKKDAKPKARDHRRP